MLELHIVERLLHEGLEHSLVFVDDVERGGGARGRARTAHGAAIDAHRLARHVAQLGVELWDGIHRGEVHLLDAAPAHIATISDQTLIY